MTDEDYPRLKLQQLNQDFLEYQQAKKKGTLKTLSSEDKRLYERGFEIYAESLRKVKMHTEFLNDEWDSETREEYEQSRVEAIETMRLSTNFLNELVFEEFGDLFDETESQTP